MLQWVTRFWDSKTGENYSEHLLLLVVFTVLKLLRLRVLPGE